MSDGATRLGRIRAWLANWKTKRNAKSNRREQDRIRRIVAKETAMITRMTEREKRRARK